MNIHRAISLDPMNYASTDAEANYNFNPSVKSTLHTINYRLQWDACARAFYNTEKRHHMEFGVFVLSLLYKPSILIYLHSSFGISTLRIRFVTEPLLDS